MLKHSKTGGVVVSTKLYTFAIRNQSPSNIEGDWLKYVEDHLISIIGLYWFTTMFILLNNNVLYCLKTMFYIAKQQYNSKIPGNRINS